MLLENSDVTTTLNTRKSRLRMSKLREAITLDLALYEALNAVWKEHSKLKKIDLETALNFATLIQKTFSIIDKPQ
ncbi:MAG: hypothetical protein QXR45_08610 [Candidatus Bathyarchaeia archaeon]